MKIKDLTPNVKNPRKISDKKRAALKASVEKFGDLGCLVYNRRTEQMIAGHQRTSGINPETKIVIEKRYDTPTRSRTVAEGYVEINGERLKYREVDADKTWEAEAMLAANKHGGQWDKDILRLLIAETPEIDIHIAGFDEVELKELDIELPTIEELELPDEEENESEEDDSEEDESVPEQIESGSDEEADAEYIKNNNGPDSELQKENIDLINREKKENPFEQVNEKMNVLDKRFIIIIDCKSSEHKTEVKSLIVDIVKNAGGNFF